MSLSNSHSKKAILLVEDEALIAMTEARMLKKNGYEVITAYNAKKAIETVKENSIDLILMDIDLGHGKMDGTRAAEIILEEHDIPIVFLSSHTEPEIVEKTEGITSYGYIVKNSGDTVLLASLKMAFRLFEAKSIYKDTFAHSINGICIHKMIYNESNGLRDCEYINVNSAFKKHTGLSPDFVNGKTIREIYPGNEADDVIDLYSEVIASGTPQIKEIYFKPTKQWYELSVFPMEDDHFSVVVQSITARKNFEKELRASEEKHRRLFETMVQGVVYQGADGTIISANPASEKLLGLSFDQMNGKTSMDSRWKMITEDGEDVPGSEHPAMIALRKGEKVGPVTRGVFVPEREEYVWLLICATPLFQPGEDKPFQVYATFNDITERKKAEKALQESEEKYYSLFDQAIEGIYLHDLEGNIIDVNKVVCEQTGYSKSELLQLSVFDIYVTGKDTITMPKAEVKRIWRQSKVGERYSFELEHKYKDGTIFPVNLSTGAIRYGNRKIIMAIVEDITERKRAEEALLKSEQEKTLILDNVGDIISYHDKNGCIAWANQAYLDSIGYITGSPVQIADVKGGRCYEMWKLEKLCVGCPVSMALQNGDITEAELSPKNQPHWPATQGSWHIKATPIRDTQGNVIGAIELARDITERKQKEEKLQKSLEEKDFLMKELNHRVNNNLAMVSSLISLKNSSSGDDVDLSDLDHRINAIRLIHEKLYQTEDVSHVNLKEYIHEIDTNVFSLSNRHVEIEEKIDDISLSTKTALPLGLIINEIATNAMKHGFTVEGDARFTVDLTEDKNNNQYILSISNNGKPFPKNVTLDNSETLGLQLLSALVSQMEGTIELQRESHPVFTICFPMEGEVGKQGKEKNDFT